MRASVLLVLLTLLAACAARPGPPDSSGKSFSENFDDAHEFPDWESRVGRWEPRDELSAPSKPHTFAQLLTGLSEPAQFVAVGHGTFGNVGLKVMFHLLPGDVPGAGVVVRYVDARNYYVAWSEGPGGAVRLIEYARGNATELARTTRPMEGTNWTLLGVTAEDDRFAVSIDGQELLTAQDTTLQVGYVGLWTPPGARSEFDNLTVARY